MEITRGLQRKSWGGTRLRGGGIWKKHIFLLDSLTNNPQEGLGEGLSPSPSPPLCRLWKLIIISSSFKYQISCGQEYLQKGFNKIKSPPPNAIAKNLELHKRRIIVGMANIVDVYMSLIFGTSLYGWISKNWPIVPLRIKSVDFGVSPACACRTCAKASRKLSNLKH